MISSSFAGGDDHRKTSEEPNVSRNMCGTSLISLSNSQLVLLRECNEDLKLPRLEATESISILDVPHIAKALINPSIAQPDLIQESIEDLEMPREAIEEMETQSHALTEQWKMLKSGVISQTSPTRDAIRAHFNSGQRQGRLRRLRIITPALSLGISLCLIGFALAEIIRISSVAGDVLMCIGLIGMLLSVLVSDKCAIRCVGAVALVLALYFLFFSALKLLRNARFMTSDENVRDGQTLNDWVKRVDVAFSSTYFFMLSATTLALLWSFQRSHVQQLRILWLLEGIYFSIHASVNYLARPIVYWSNDILLGSGFHHPAVAMSGGIFMILLACTSCQERFRMQVQARLGSWGETDVSAAVIAELLGKNSAEAILERAVDSFYFVSAEKLTPEDMADSCPNPLLGRHVDKGRLGHVDAFLSHSWHDDASEKWLELQAWRENFKSIHRREPRLWIDKYCIDQNDIEKSLSCLPVYLAGCRRVLVLHGSTYLKRLWCILELYVFHAMRRPIEDLEVRTLLTTRSTSDSMKEEIAKFQVHHARCFLQEDTERLVSIMEAAGNDLICFLDVIRRKLLDSMESVQHSPSGNSLSWEQTRVTTRQHTSST